MVIMRFALKNLTKIEPQTTVLFRNINVGYQMSNNFLFAKIPLKTAFKTVAWDAKT